MTTTDQKATDQKSPEPWIAQAKADLATMPAEQWMRLYAARLLGVVESAAGVLGKSSGALREASATSAAGWRLSEQLSKLCLALFRDIGWKSSQPWPKMTPKRWATLRSFVLGVLAARTGFLEQVAAGLGEPVRGVPPPAGSPERPAGSTPAREARYEGLLRGVRERAAGIRGEVAEAMKVPKSEVH